MALSDVSIISAYAELRLVYRCAPFILQESLDSLP